MRARNPATPTCQLRLGGWACQRSATGYVRERDTGRDRFKPWGFSVAVCDECAPLAETFADSLGLATNQQSLDDFRRRHPRF
jgi:hypothetical protein